jgi:hypothetical protein
MVTDFLMLFLPKFALLSRLVVLGTLLELVLTKDFLRASLIPDREFLSFCTEPFLEWLWLDPRLPVQGLCFSDDYKYCCCNL